MTTIEKIKFIKDLPNKKITVVRYFDAPVEKVWRAWTEKELLDQWWAPKPWKAVSRSMDIREGGSWLYAMEGPEGERHWAKVDFKTIVKPKSIVMDDYFVDENGKRNEELPFMNWHCEFMQEDSRTRVSITITADKVSDLEKIMEMGFEEGFTAALGNLDSMF
jgi:PhnB protein